jgi:hypothetical protein
LRNCSKRFTTSHSISEGLAEDAEVTAAGKSNSWIESAEVIRIVLSMYIPLLSFLFKVFEFAWGQRDGKKTEQKGRERNIHNEGKRKRLRRQLSFPMRKAHVNPRPDQTREANSS